VLAYIQAMNAACPQLKLNLLVGNLKQHSSQTSDEKNMVFEQQKRPMSELLYAFRSCGSAWSARSGLVPVSMIPDSGDHRELMVSES